MRPGDSIAVRVECAGLGHVAVVAGGARLSDACPGPPGLLPFTLVVDDAAGRERFAVVLSRTRLDDDALHAAVAADTHDRDVWVTHFDLPKDLP